jgi:hypothetical protein
MRPSGAAREPFRGSGAVLTAWATQSLARDSFLLFSQVINQGNSYDDDGDDEDDDDDDDDDSDDDKDDDDDDNDNDDHDGNDDDDDRDHDDFNYEMNYTEFRMIIQQKTTISMYFTCT